MLVNVRPDLLFLAKPNAAISGICANGAALGVKPGEFVFLDAPAWVLDVWTSVWPSALPSQK